MPEFEIPDETREDFEESGVEKSTGELELADLNLVEEMQNKANSPDPDTSEQTNREFMREAAEARESLDPSKMDKNNPFIDSVKKAIEKGKNLVKGIGKFTGVDFDPDKPFDDQLKNKGNEMGENLKEKLGLDKDSEIENLKEQLEDQIKEADKKGDIKQKSKLDKALSLISILTGLAAGAEALYLYKKFNDAVEQLSDCTEYQPGDASTLKKLGCPAGTTAQRSKVKSLCGCIAGVSGFPKDGDEDLLNIGCVSANKDHECPDWYYTYKEESILGFLAEALNAIMNLPQNTGKFLSWITKHWIILLISFLAIIIGIPVIKMLLNNN